MAKKVVIWGTGKLARNMIKLHSRISEYGKLPAIEFFIDSNKDKCGNKFYDCDVVHPNDVVWDEDLFIIISPAKSLPIQKLLDGRFYVEGIDYILGDFFPRWIFLNLKEYPSDANIVLGFRTIILNYDFGNINEKVNKLKQRYGAAAYYGAVHAFCGSDYFKARAWISDNRTGEVKERKKVIAFYYARFTNGGIERVIHELIIRFIDAGYTIILITDDEETSQDFKLPLGAYRVVMGDTEYDQYTRCIFWEQVIAKYNIDVFCYHAYANKHAFYDIAYIQNEFKIPVIVECHTSIEGMRALNFMYAEMAFRQAALLVTLSIDSRNYWKNKGCKSMYIPNPTSPPKDMKYEEQDEPIILWIGRIDQDEKRVLDVPIIVELIKKEIENVKLKIVGKADSPLIEAKLVEEILNRGLKDNIEFCGYQLDVAKYYKEADVLLNTSSFEGFPMTISESMSYGLPIVMYDLPYLELLKSHKGYISVPMGDYNAAANALIQLLQNEDMRMNLSNEAIDNCSYFSRINITEIWEQAFESLRC